MEARRTQLGWLLVGAALALSGPAACRSVAAGRAGRSPAAAAPPARVVRLTRDLGFTGITWWVELRQASPGGSVRGTMRVTTGGANADHVARQFGCRVRPTAGTDGGGESLLACAVPFARGAPDWAAVLARLDALGVMAPPRDPTSAEREIETCSDAAFWALEVLVAGMVTVRDAQVCGPRSTRRAAYEAGVDSAFDAVVDVARVGRP